MKTLREEIAGLRVVEYVDQPTPVNNTAYNEALDDVLTLIDKRIDDNVNEILSKPQDETLSRGDERPARAKVASWSADKRNGDEPSCVLAIVKALDALGERFDGTLNMLVEQAVLARGGRA